MKVFKKILLGLLLLVSTISLSQGFTMGNRVLMGGVVTPTPPSEITLTSTSTSATWSPFDISNLGSTLDWTVSGGVTIATTTIDDPTFNFSTNSGTANVLIENTDDLQLFKVPQLDITTIDVTQATSLINLGVNVNDLTLIDVSNNILLTDLNLPVNDLTAIDVSNNVLLINLGLSFNDLTTIDVSNNVLLDALEVHFNSLTALDISSNILINTLNCRDNLFSSGVLDQIYIDLDNNGVSTGFLDIDLGRTSASDTARANLITKNWTIQEF